MKKLIFLILCLSLVSNLYAESNDSNMNEKRLLTINEAIEKAISSNPAILALLKQEEISNGLLKQAKISPKPSLSVGAEDFAGNGEYKKTSSMKSTIGLTQTIETAGKRHKRIRLADLSKSIELLKIEIAKKEMKLEVASSFIKLYQLSNELEIQKESIQLASQTANSVNQKVTAGELAQIDATRAFVEVTREETVKKHLELDIASLRQELATLLGEKSFEYDGISINSQSILEKELLKIDKIDIEQLPELALAKAELELAKAEHKMTKAENVSDIDLSLNYSKYRATSDHAFGIQASIPLSQNNNKGKIQSAKAIVDAAELRIKNVSSNLSAKINTSFQEMESLAKEVLNIETMLLPAAKESYKQVQIAFDSGEKNLIDLFDSKKSLLETELLLLELRSKLFSAICEYAILTRQI